jgi:hypothetical protein
VDGPARKTGGAAEVAEAGFSGRFVASRPRSRAAKSPAILATLL